MTKLLLLHGALGSKRQFNKLEGLLKEKFEVHSINFTGHGGESIPEDAFSIEMFAGDIIKFLYDKNIEKISVFGYSMGGYAALYAAKHFPGKFEKIFTLATKFDWNPETAAREIKMLDIRTIKAKVPAFAEELAGRHGAAVWESVLVRTADMMTSLGKDNTLKPDDYSGIECAVTLSVGDRDKMVSLEETIAVYRKLKNGRLLVLPATPHPLEGVDADILAAEISRFLK